ncbi:hypothetical protein ACOSQ2_019034 [Xanthoceras sorbifolium]
MMRPIEKVMKKVGLSDVSESSGSSVTLKGSTDSKLRPLAHVTSTGIVDLEVDDEGGPLTVVVDDILEGVVRGEILVWDSRIFPAKVASVDRARRLDRWRLDLLLRVTLLTGF